MKAFPNLSPFCLKLECYLRLAEIKYKATVFIRLKSNLNFKMVENLSVMHRSSEGTLPYIELNGQDYNDSAFIVRDLPRLLGKLMCLS